MDKEQYYINKHIELQKELEKEGYKVCIEDIKYLRSLWANGLSHHKIKVHIESKMRSDPKYVRLSEMIMNYRLFDLIVFYKIPKFKEV